jgi:hypothetical protein
MYRHAFTKLKLKLLENCRDFVLENPKDILSLEATVLLDVLSFNFLVDEIVVFNMLKNWKIKHEDVSPEIWTALINKVCLVSMKAEDIRDIVYPSKLIPCFRVIEALTIMASKDESEQAKYNRNIFETECSSCFEGMRVD